MTDFFFHNLSEHYGFTWPENAGDIVDLLVTIGGIIALCFWVFSRAKKYGLVCPTCGCQLTDKVAHRKVLVSGRCPKCQKEVFDDESVIGARRSGGLEREEFKEQLEHLTGQSNRESMRLLIVIFAAMTGCVPIAKYVQRLVERGELDWLGWVPSADWKLIAGIILTALSLIAFGIVLVAMRGKFNPRHLSCPECNRSLVGAAGHAAIESGLCIYCGCRLFETPASKT